MNSFSAGTAVCLIVINSLEIDQVTKWYALIMSLIILSLFCLLGIKCLSSVVLMLSSQINNFHVQTYVTRYMIKLNKEQDHTHTVL